MHATDGGQTCTFGQVCRQDFNKSKGVRKTELEECTYSQEATVLELHPDTNTQTRTQIRAFCDGKPDDPSKCNSTKDLWERGGEGRGNHGHIIDMCKYLESSPSTWTSRADKQELRIELKFGKADKIALHA